MFVDSTWDHHFGTILATITKTGSMATNVADKGAGLVSAVHDYRW
jgi:hypothetical protein